jgi:hypothetical protein
MEASVMNTTKEQLLSLSADEAVDWLFEEVKDDDLPAQDGACALLRESHGLPAVKKLRGRLASYAWSQSGEDSADDNDNAAENVRRKLERMDSALRYVPVTEELKGKVWNVLGFMSQASPEAGVALWVAWLRRAGVGDMEARRLWSSGYSEAAIRADTIYEVAQARDWKYPIWHSPARVNLMVPRRGRVNPRQSSSLPERR